MERFCDNCQEICEVTTKKLTEKFKVRDVEIEATITVRVCKKCGEEIWDRKLEKANDVIVFDKYKETVNLLTSKQITAIREKYSLSQVSFSRLLGFGDKTITRYENGSIQDVSHDLLIRLMDDVATFKKIWVKRKYFLSDRENKFIKDLLATREIIMEPFKYENLRVRTQFIKEGVNYGGLQYVGC